MNFRTEMNIDGELREFGVVENAIPVKKLSFKEVLAGPAGIGDVVRRERVEDETSEEGRTPRRRVIKESKSRSRDIDLFHEARKSIGLYPIKPNHILKHHQGEYYPCVDDIPTLYEEIWMAAKEFLAEELKWKEDISFTTKWTEGRNFLWVTFLDESLLNSIFRILAEVCKEGIKLLRYTPTWC